MKCKYCGKEAEFKLVRKDDPSYEVNVCQNCLSAGNWTKDWKTYSLKEDAKVGKLGNLNE